MEDKEGKKSIKRVTTHGYYLRVKDPLAVLQHVKGVGSRGLRACRMMSIRCA